MPLEPATTERPASPPPRATSFVSGLRTVATSTVLSRVLGMIRDRATGELFGLSPVADAFAFAFRIPNLARRLFGEGALSAAFLPVFARELEKDESTSRSTDFQSAQKEVSSRGHNGWQLASVVFTLMSLALLALVAIGEGVLYLLSLRFAG